MANQSTMLGELRCRVVDRLPRGRNPIIAVVLCHGFGAPGTDLVPLADELYALEPSLAENVRFIFPEAPLSLDEQGIYGGRAWWHLDVNRLVAAVETGEFRNLRDAVPIGLDEARRLLMSSLDDLRQETRLANSQFVLGGFSQGSMLATDVMLRLEERPAGLCIFSGTLLCEQEWRTLAGQAKPIPVLQSHGQQDPILPYQAALWLRDMLVEAGFPVEFIPFNGIHTIPFEAIVRFAQMLRDIAGQQSQTD